MIEKYVLPQDTSILALKSKTRNYAFELDLSSVTISSALVHTQRQANKISFGKTKLGDQLKNTNGHSSQRIRPGQAQDRLAKRQVEQILGHQPKLFCFTGPNDAIKFNT